MFVKIIYFSFLIDSNKLSDSDSDNSHMHGFALELKKSFESNLNERPKHKKTVH